MAAFYQFQKIKNCRKTEMKIITGQEMLKLRILSSVATLKALKSGNGVGTSCYEYK